MKAKLIDLLRVLYSDDTLLDCIDYINDSCPDIEEYDLSDILTVLYTIKTDIVGE